ncbi:type IX secretion system sortase PorU [Flavobacterium sp. Sd200]|uniref:type IX secretion system sortase PorU n=1 Tax=Flavobacterium sp. Sd200 TaxID=2692211 RepID=UPI001372158F|nr:type IX secretion system sortase PorU [Flavobacterium sp. Sd200]MXN90893.1 type IX secretion system sortase PorU [Flavobacterium sp. Sd200]
MKNRLFLFVLLFSLLSYGQQRENIVLNWKDNVATFIGQEPFVMPQFDSEYMNFDPGLKQLLFGYKFEVAGEVDSNSLLITNVVYENITVAQLGGLDSGNIPSNINAAILSARARNTRYARLTLSPVIKEGSSFKRIKSFTYSYSLGGNAQRSVQSVAAVTSSVLSGGEWVRFYVEKSGVYRVSRSFLQQIGLNVNVDPQTIKIYGHGGRMAPLLNGTPYANDLVENAIKFIGEEDGRFDNNDYILFYAEGVDNWNADSGTHNNLYADRSYYYVTSGGGNGKRIAEAAQPVAAANTQTSVFDDYQFYEKDLVNIARLGRKWHGEQFNITNVHEFAFSVPDIVTTEPVSITVAAAAYSASTSSMSVEANGSAVGTLSLAPTTDSNISASENSATYPYTASADGSVRVKLTYNNNGVPSANAWLDYIILRSKRNLDGNGKQFRFRYNAAANNTGVIQYNFTSSGGIAEVWDITDIYNATKITNSTGNQFSFKAVQGEVRQYIAVEGSDYYTPLRESNSRVANQDLKGTIFRNSTGQFQDIDYLIITPAFLNGTAESLAAYHRNRSGLNVKVVNLENIYQEFSSGKQDIAAIRNFIKYVYNNASTAEKRVKYINLFGDASFDYKNRIRNNSNIVPIFHGYSPIFSGNQNFSIVNTFCTDDFYGLMDDNEGSLQLSGGVLEELDIAVGRMLVKDRAQAEQMVNKVFEYESPEAYGRWRNEFITAVDDLDGDGSLDFVNVIERGVVVPLERERPYVNIRKFYLDAYVQQSSSGGQRYPDAKEQFIRAINYGALVVNYFGHGGETGMASERLFETSDAQNLTNRYKYPLFITATCDVTKFDNPFMETAGENIYWNPTGGAIAMITTTRALFITNANLFNPEIIRRLYAFGQNEYPTMAEAMRQAKLTNNSPNIRMICFIGDPALKMAIPKPNILLTTINDVPVAQSTDVLQSLGRVKLGGIVTDVNNNMLSSYNGEVEVAVFDKNIDRITLANDFPSDDSLKIPFTTLGETIFRGSAVVTNGQFQFSFVVPRDIRIPVGNGRISFYSKRNNVLEDHMGYNSVIKVGGINTNAAVDNTAPTVKLYMNTETFISGGITNASPILLAYLEDANGINTASGIGHDIIGILDGDDTVEYLMNDYYEADLNDYSHGTVRFPFANLSPGLHTLTFRAWDVYNNLVTAEIQFVVAGDEGVTLEKVLNYPNPFVSYTEFWFSHNRPFEPLDVQVQVFTVTGKIVKTINQTVTTDGFLCRDLKWDGRDDFGDKIGKGVYIYKLTVKSTTTNKKAEKYEKLVLL